MRDLFSSTGLRFPIARLRDCAIARFFVVLLLGSFVFVSCTSTNSVTRGIPSVSEMSLDEKVGQLFIYGINGDFVNAGSSEYRALLHQIRDNKVGGLIWYTADVYETAWLNERAQRESKIPLIIAADLEAGIGMRFNDTTFWPYAMAMAATGDPSLVERAGRVTAQDAKLLGINQVYAPVADVSNNPDNPIINTRSFGEDPQQVGEFVAAFVRGVQSEGVLATAKHFPGHGDVVADSHRALPLLDVTRARLDAIELVPFRAAIASGVSSVMTAHLALPQLDSTPTPPLRGEAEGHVYQATEQETAGSLTLPASLSHALTTDLLRRDLGFNGLVVTDATDMGGITRYFDPGESAVRAIEAGADQIVKPLDVDAGIVAIKAAVRSGRIPMSTLDAAVGRVLRAKEKVSFRVAPQEEIFSNLDSPQSRELAQEIASRAITLVREQPATLPLKREMRVLVVQITDTIDPTTSLAPFHRELASRLATPPATMVLDQASLSDEVTRVADAARSADLVIFAYTIRFRDGKGTISAPPIAREAAARVSETGVPIIGLSFGTPYLLRDVPMLGTYVVGYGVQPVIQVAMARALAGEKPITGKLPVSIPGMYPVGHGISKE